MIVVKPDSTWHDYVRYCCFRNCYISTIDWYWLGWYFCNISRTLMFCWACYDDDNGCDNDEKAFIFKKNISRKVYIYYLFGVFYFKDSLERKSEKEINLCCWYFMSDWHTRVQSVWKVLVFYVYKYFHCTFVYNKPICLSSWLCGVENMGDK